MKLFYVSIWEMIASSFIKAMNHINFHNFVEYIDINKNIITTSIIIEILSTCRHQIIFVEKDNIF